VTSAGRIVNKNGKLEHGMVALFSSQAGRIQIRHSSPERKVNIIGVTPTSWPADVSQPKPHCSHCVTDCGYTVQLLHVKCGSLKSTVCDLGFDSVYLALYSSKFSATQILQAATQVVNTAA
jgi:hypothetical protein